MGKNRVNIVDCSHEFLRLYLMVEAKTTTLSLMWCLTYVEEILKKIAFKKWGR